jgi:DNA topoisomerase-1
MVTGIGRFGPFVRHKNKFYSLKKGIDDPFTLTAERATEIIKEKNEKRFKEDFE